MLGINLSAVVDWSSEWAFENGFKHSRPWMVRYSNESIPGGRELQQLDEHGWPKYLHHNQWMETLLYREIDGKYPAGPYVVLYEGSGLLEFQFDARIVQAKKGRIDLTVRPTHGGILMRLRASDPSDPIRNIRIVRADALETFEEQPFHPLFLERLSPYSVIRFMDWQRTNNSTLSSWDERPTPRDATQSTHKGVALEHMIQLCNISEKDPWFCIPHNADDEFVSNFAHLVKEQLHPDRKIYIEYSNEVWNGIFRQAKHAEQAGIQLALSEHAFEAQLRYYAQRSVEVFQIWERVFEGRTRLVRILAAQSANPWTSETILSWKQAHKHCDALAIAPYFGGEFGTPEGANAVLQREVEDLLQGLEDKIEENAKLIAQHKKLASKWGLRLIAYEGGQHLAGHGGMENKPELIDRFVNANRHPIMRKLYLKDHRLWTDNGGELFVYYNSISRPSKWGSWGLLEYQSQDISEAPKYQAVKEIANSEVRP